MVKGNIAVAEAAVRAGVEVYAGYPITPSTEAMEYLPAVCRSWAARLCRPRASWPASTSSWVRPPAVTAY
ncbi:MAG: hypothetical protein ACLUNO_13355 [Oscillospiraceae bacterium]